VQFDKAAESQDIREKLTATFGAPPEVKTYGFTGKFQITTSYLIDDTSEEATTLAETKLTEGLAQFGDN
jgi:hypothetical protein